MQKLISVVIPAYNSESRIKFTLESILNQDYKNFEIILVNDVSTDNTAKIADEILAGKNIPFRIINHEKNRGECASRNTGIENSRGEYICFIDSDDMIEKNFLSRLYELAEKYNSDIAFCGMKHRFEFAGKNKRDMPEEMNLSAPYSRYGEEFLYLRILGRASPHVCSMMFRKNFIEKYKLRFHEGCIAGGDVEFQIKALCRAEKVSFMNECLYIYMHHEKMGSVRDNDTIEKKLTRYEHNTNAQIRAEKYLLEFAKMKESRKLAEKILMPQNIIRQFTISAIRNDKAKYSELVRDKNFRDVLKRSQCLYVMNKRPEIFFKAFMILHCPEIYYKMRNNKRR